MFKLLSTFIAVTSLLFSSMVSAGNVSRAQFTTAIQEREPVDMVETLSSEQTLVNYFTELSDLEGHTVTHQWGYNDEIMFEKSFQVGGTRWRVWSSKSLSPHMTGTWIVNTLDEDRNKLLTQGFDYQ